MNLNESIVEDAALQWFGELGYPPDLQEESTLANALSQARQFGLKPDAARAIIKEVGTRVAGWKEHFKAKGVAAKDIALLAQYIDGDTLRHQRDEFSMVARPRI